ncbi:MAG: type IV pilus modification protein PilV [Sinobacteraceae bacterium]|nr:type IV pilus modification protein PilV [Nevskiaceae bacterium]
MSSKHATRHRPHDTGFSLVEVMVALVVMSVGLLGIAKMQGLALSNTTTSRMRSLVALEAASLASTMRADRTYWSEVTADPNVAISGGTVTSTGDTNLVAATNCPSCTPAQIAMNDLGEWATELSSVASVATATVSCAVVAGTPNSCKITVSWVEQVVASNAQQATQIQQGGAPAPTNYILYVDP